jgi:dGTP triphosphohydrolase
LYLFRNWVHLRALFSDCEKVEDQEYRFAHVINYVSGMTDSYALKTYTDLFGCSPLV